MYSNLVFISFKYSSQIAKEKITIEDNFVMIAAINFLLLEYGVERKNGLLKFFF